MAGTIQIPLTTLPIGTTVVGPATVAAVDSSAIVFIDRTVVGGLNSLTTASKLHITYEISFDNGATWNFLGDARFEGGIRTDPELGQLNTDYFEVGLDRPGASGRRVRASLAVAGTTIAVAGSLVVS